MTPRVRGGAPEVPDMRVGHRMGSIPRLPFLLRLNLPGGGGGGGKWSETNKIDDVGFVNSKVRKQGIMEVMLHRYYIPTNVGL